MPPRNSLHPASCLVLQAVSRGDKEGSSRIACRSTEDSERAWTVMLEFATFHIKFKKCQSYTSMKELSRTPRLMEIIKRAG